MGQDGVETDVQLVGNLLVGDAFRYQLQHVDLTSGELFAALELLLRRGLEDLLQLLNQLFGRGVGR